MKRLWLAARKLWLLASCDHGNGGRQIDFDDTTSIRVCHRCGIVMQIVLTEAGKSSLTESARLGQELILARQESR